VKHRPVSHGNVQLPVFSWAYSKKGRVYQKWQVRWQGAPRQIRLGVVSKVFRKEFPNEEEARSWAKAKAKELHERRGNEAVLPEHEVLAWRAWRLALSKLGIDAEEGLRRLRGGTEAFFRAHDRLPGLSELRGFEERAWADAVARYSSRLQRVDGAAAIVRFLDDKRRLDSIGIPHGTDLEDRLVRVADAFPGPVCDWAPAEIWAWLKARRVEGRALENKTLVNYRTALVGFFKWAASEGLVSREASAAAEGLKKPVVAVKMRDIWRAEELKRLLREADKTDRHRRLIPYLVIGAFAAVRAAELKRLEWPAVDLEHGFIEISGEIAKGRRSKPRPRVVALPENCRRWLTRFGPKGAGLRERIAPYMDMHKFLRRVAASAGLPWLHNVLRRSASSHAKAIGVSLEDVARQAGNSATMARVHYVNRTAKYQDAEAWFALGPEACELHQPEFRLLADASAVANQSRTSGAARRA